ncbi:MAG: 23S rRNA (adenine(2503)-C(2))-methyltransferase RlmN, partial [Bifidobacteriaceae bacterium]|nr:23S rRNA (adenine(2503)-C(2))-methyltransferase RlmN [Bifidobacteriaceae bacterium]
RGGRGRRAARPPRHLADWDAAGRAEWAREAGLAPLRAKQVANHYFARLENNPKTMTDLPKAERADLAGRLVPTLLEPLAQRTADAGTTLKQLWGLAGGARIETVLMRYPDRITVCVSAQAGCGMGCPFCATGRLGLVRNLSAAEIVEQVRLTARTAREGGLAGGPGRLSNVVFMGMGEPLANLGAVLQAVNGIVRPPPEGFGISARGLTVSTCGLAPAMGRLAQAGLPLRLAVSLHAPDNALRDQLVPVNRRWPVERVLDAAHAYFRATGRRVSIEYALMRDVNDQAWRARLLAQELRRRGSGWAHVNPIPLNPVPGSRWTASEPAAEAEFVEHLRIAGIQTTIRDTRGADIDGACGQLAAEES